MKTKKWNKKQKGILLHGPPGVGKTWSVRTVAQSYNARLLVIEGSQVYSMFSGESEAFLRKVFNEAESYTNEKPCIVFIDEIVKKKKKYL